MPLLPKLLLLIAGLAVSQVLAGAPARAAQFYTEDLRIPMAEAGPQGLKAFLVRPAGTKRYGGRGSRDDHEVCNEDGLVQAFASFGKTSRVPMLWVYATNDSYFGPDLARRPRSDSRG